MAGEQWDAPNQQVVRADESPPWQPGEGGSDYDDLAWTLSSVTPAAKSVSEDDDWTVTADGVFPSQLNAADLTLDLETALAGQVWNALDVTGVTASSLTAHYSGAPTNPDAVGTGAAVLKYAGTEVARTAFEWTE